ncbi:bifunctional diguanylate cyclase/phosphodiesterase [Halomonas llamarensis]|uniref:EAL domain-containing protein n=1 Tax=Halomonas llamarensis TaxID=2945104 RepID=A0ABT0SKP5_9GAMM|nr:bifunctional diguanylate cyclase/phosphodiesterase [Halomonas llamarensis]MCL7928382.1 EAL domain-containing protein [Halomonas llamarensis]
MKDKKGICKYGLRPGLRKKTLTAKLTLYVTTSTLVVGLLLGIFLGQKNFNNTINNAYALANERIEMIKEPASLALYHLDQATVEALVKSLSSDPSYNSIRIFSDGDRLFASVTNAESTDDLSDKIIRYFFSDVKKRKIYPLYRDVPHPDKNEIYVGRIDYNIDVNHLVSQSLANFVDIFLITIYQSLILSFIIASIMYWLVGRPLSEFAKYIKRRAKGRGGDEEFRIKTHGSELKALVENYKFYTQENEEYLFELTEKNRYLDQLSRRDTLTGGYNRRELISQLEKYLNKENKWCGNVLVVSWDIDQFSRINSQYGQDVGDQVLVAVYRHLKEYFNDGESMFRLQPDVFALYFFEKDNNDIIQRIEKKLSFDVEVDGASLSTCIRINLTAGVAQAPDDALEPEALLYATSIGLFNAKQAGHNCVRRYSPETEESRKSNFSALNALREQLEAPSFFLMYQPKVYFSNGEVAGCEALFRTDRKRNCAPFELLNCAEDTGLIVSLGMSIIALAIKDFSPLLVNFQDRFRLSVNVSPQQLIEPDFSSQLKKLLNDFSFPGCNLDLEVTEATQLISNSNFHKNQKELSDFGVSFSLDDFGTGYASIEYLLFIGFDFLKVDRQFVKNIPDDYNSLRICKLILKLAKEVGSQAVVEGIENEVHALLMQQEGAEFGQGYHYSKPLELEDFIRYCKENGSYLDA